MTTHLDVQVVDLPTVRPAELEDLWLHELCLWRDHLRWDISDVVATLRRLVARGALPRPTVEPCQAVNVFQVSIQYDPLPANPS